MRMAVLVSGLLSAALVAVLAGPLRASAFAQSATADKQEPPAKVDFVRDVQPIFRQSCYGCHGPSQRMGGFRLDRRGDAMRGGTIAVIGPGNSAGSRLYLKLIGSDYGPQMPMTGPLKPEQIATIKTWIDQGAEWPDAASGETPLPPLDPSVVKLHDAALHGDPSRLRALLDQKIDPNARDHAGLTPLMLAINDVDRVKLLLDRGADVNAKSEAGRTPLMIAAGQSGNAAVVKLLLDRGAKVDPKASSFLGETNALAEAAYAGDEGTMRLLIDRGADPKTALAAIALAVAARCQACVDLLAGAADKEALTMAALFSSPPLFDTTSVIDLVKRGADVNARDGEGRTLLMLAASVDLAPVETVQALLSRGADVNATSKKGQTALGLAGMRGRTPVVDALTKAGARGDSAPPLAASFSPAATARAAVERSIPILQKNAITFREKSGCVSCHNNSLAAYAVSAARANSVRVDEALAKTEVVKTAAYLASWRDRVVQGIGIPGDADSISYLLFGMAAERLTANDDTAAMIRFMRRFQASDGRWGIIAHRPPIESSDVEVTALTLRAIQNYGAPSDSEGNQRAVARAASWLATAPARTLEDHAFKVAGLSWTHQSALVQRAVKALIAEQRPDGGFAQLPTLTSDAYATGLALFAMKESGMKPADPAYTRAIQFLLRTQAADGTWHVASRAIPLQPFFESGFPYGRDQFVSAAATGWATAALASAIR